MKRSRDEPTNKYSCYTYDGNEDTPTQNLHFVDVGLSITSPERLVDVFTHNRIVQGLVGLEAITALATPPPQPQQQPGNVTDGTTNFAEAGKNNGIYDNYNYNVSNGNKDNCSNNMGNSYFNQRTAAHAANGVRNLEQRLQPVAKGFPALQFFSHPFVVGAEVNFQNEEMSVYYIKDDASKVCGAVKALLTASASSPRRGGALNSGSASDHLFNGVRSASVTEQQQCPNHFFRCSCTAFSAIGTALRRLYEEFNGAFDWDVYVAEEEERRRALHTTTSHTSTTTTSYSTMRAVVAVPSSYASSNFPQSSVGGAFPNCGGAATASQSQQQGFSHFLSMATDTCPPAPPASPNTAGTVTSTTTSSTTYRPMMMMQASQLITKTFRPSLSAPKAHAYCVGSGLMQAVEIRPIPPSTVAGNLYWYNCLEAYSRHITHRQEGTTTTTDTGGPREVDPNNTDMSGGLDIEAIQCLYEAFASYSEDDLLATVSSRSDLMMYRHRHYQQKWLSPMLQQHLARMASNNNNNYSAEGHRMNGVHNCNNGGGGRGEQEEEDDAIHHHHVEDGDDINMCSTAALAPPSVALRGIGGVRVGVGGGGSLGIVGAEDSSFGVQSPFSSTWVSPSASAKNSPAASGIYSHTLNSCDGGGHSGTHAPNASSQAGAPLAVVLFLNVPVTESSTSTPSPSANINSSTNSGGGGGGYMSATHAAIFITTPNAPLTLARRIIGPIPMLENDTPLSVMSALSLSSKLATATTTARSGVHGGPSSPSVGATSAVGGGTLLADFPRCATCKQYTANLIYCRLCNQNRICPPPPSAHQTIDSLHLLQPNSSNTVAGSNGAGGCFLQYQCSACHVVSCANCCVKVTINGIARKKCLECLAMES